MLIAAILFPSACSKATPPPKTPSDTTPQASRRAVHKNTATTTEAGPVGKLLILRLASPVTPQGNAVRGEISFIEKSGKNLYLEMKVGSQTVGVELLPAVVKAYRARLSKGQTVAVQGKKSKGEDNKGEDDIAFVIEVRNPKDLHLPGLMKAPARLVSPRIATSFRPGPKVEMIAAIGAWPPIARHEIASKVAAVAKDNATLLVADSGLTELWKAYEAPKPYYDVIKYLASQANGHRLRTAFYFPSFELRRTKKTRGSGKTRRSGSLLKKARSWAQVTLQGKPLIKTRFDKEEFWNKTGDEALWVSPLSPWRQVFIERIKEAVARGVRTVFIDVPYFQGGKTFITGASTYAASAFKKATGLALPKRRAPGDMTYHRWLWWRHQVLRDFFADLRQAIRKVASSARLVVEEYPTYVNGATTQTGLDIGLIGSEVDAFAHEYSLKQFDKKSFSFDDRVKIFSTLSLYRGLDGVKPTWVLSYAHDARGSRANAAIHLALDASFWETKAPEMNDTTVSRSWRRKLFAWFSKHREVFGHSSPLASVAVVYSPRARDFCPNHFTTLRAITRRLTKLGITYRVVSTRDVSTRNWETLANHEVALLPAICALSPKEARDLRHLGAKVPLVAIGRRPTKGAWGIKTAEHHLPIPLLKLDQILTAIQKRWVRIDAPREVAVAMMQHGAHEVQLRFLSLRGKKVRVKASVRLPIKSATVLPYLGKSRPLPLNHKANTVSFAVEVSELTIIRLRF